MAATPVPKGQYKPYTQTELFAANMLEWPVKDDLASMEFPLFSSRSGQIRRFGNTSARRPKRG